MEMYTLQGIDYVDGCRESGLEKGHIANELSTLNLLNGTILDMMLETRIERSTDMVSPLSKLQVRSENGLIELVDSGPLQEDPLSLSVYTATWMPGSKFLLDWVLKDG